MKANWPKRVRWVAVIAASAVVVCVLLLTWNHAVARSQAPKDEEIIAALQKEVRLDSSFAPKLEAEQKRITEVRQARRARNGGIAIALIVASAAFVASAKLLVALRGPRPPPMSRLVQVKAGPAPGASKSALAGRRRAAESFSGTAAADEAGLALVEEIIEREGRSKEAAIPILQAIQSQYRYLPDEVLRRVCELTEITPGQIAGTSSFYAQFRRSPVGKHVVRVCHGTACHVAGARQITEELRRHLEIPDGADTDPKRLFTVDEVACLGCCSLAPVLMVDDCTVGKLTPAAACGAIDSTGSKEPA